METYSDVNDNLVEQGQQGPRLNEPPFQEKRINKMKMAYIFFVLIVLQGVKVALTGFALFSSIRDSVSDSKNALGDSTKAVSTCGDWKLIVEITSFFIISTVETMIGIVLFMNYPIITVGRLRSHMKLYGLLFAIEINCIGLALLTLSLPNEIIFFSMFITINEVIAIAVSFCNILRPDRNTMNFPVPNVVVYSNKLPYSSSGIRHF